MSSERHRRHEDDPPPSLGVLFDEKLPGPLYGLPPVDDRSYRLGTYPRPMTEQDLRGQRERFELELLSWKAMWNADLPIHRLPAEVLLQIFETFLVSVHPPDVVPPQRSFFMSEAPVRPWMLLMGVCRRWCAWIRNATCFWREIIVTPDTPHAWIDAALHRVGCTPIRVEVTSAYGVHPVLMKLAEHGDHIEIVKFSSGVSNGPDKLAFHAFTKSLSLTMLRSLEIVQDSEASFLNLRVLRGPCAQLESLSLARCSLPWTKSVVANLKVLSLRDCRLTKPSTIAFAHFLDILEHGQQLQYLHLDDFLSMAVHPQPSVPLTRFVTLPHLRYLTCHDVTADVVAHLVAHLHIPEIVDIDLLGECSDDHTNTCSSLLPSDLARAPFLSTISSVQLGIGDTENYISTSHPMRLKLTLWVPGARWGPMTERALLQLPILFGKALTVLHIMADVNDVTQETWGLIFDSFPSLQKLEFGRLGEDLPSAAIRSLAAPVSWTDGDAGGSVRCRKLKNFWVDGWKWDRAALEDALECLLFRVASGAPKLELVDFSVEELDSESADAVREENRPRFSEVAENFCFTVSTWS